MAHAIFLLPVNFKLLQSDVQTDTFSSTFSHQ